MRSIWSSGRYCHEAVPKSARTSGTPSTSTSVCRLSAPRRNRLACEPSGPVCATSMLVSARSRPGRSPACTDSISRRVITRVLGSASGRACSVRAAVTTTTAGSVAVCARSGAVMTRQDNARATPTRIVGVQNPRWFEDMEESQSGSTCTPASPQARTSWSAAHAATPCWPVSGLAQQPVQAFPEPTARRPVAGMNEREVGAANRARLRALTVAGAARVGARPTDPHLPIPVYPASP